MILVLKAGASEGEIKDLESRIRKHGNDVRRIHGKERSVLAVLGTIKFDRREFEGLPGVAEVLAVSRPYKLASKEVKQTSVVRVGDIEIGGKQVVIMAGPCAVENRQTVLEVAKRLSPLGITILRGGAFKPRTSPYSFQGLGIDGLKILAEARERYGVKVITEVMSPDKVDVVARYADIVQIGARNMQNFDLLKAVSEIKKPVLLKRGLSATIEEWLQAAEYILSGKNENVILCERGIRTFETTTRNTLDLNCIPVLRRLTHLPILVDPSHATGVRDYVLNMSLAAVAAGADGLLIEVHPDPDKALSDGPQSIRFEQLEQLVSAVKAICPVVGRTLHQRHHIELKNATLTPKKRGAKRDVRVAFQGEQGAFSEEAAAQFFGDHIVAVPRRSFRDVFESVDSGEVPYGILPVENSLTGSTLPVYDLILEFNVGIVGEAMLRVSHNLIAHKGVRMEDLRTIYVYPQAAMQCDSFLRRNKKWEVVMAYDTAGSVRMIKEKKLFDAAAIASKRAAEKWDMAILKEAIESSPLNYTRFIIVSKIPFRDSSSNKMSLVFDTKNEPGALAYVLNTFKERKINLTKLESRPIVGKPWEYMFFVDIEGNPRDKNVKKALSEVESKTVFLKVLGSYHRA